MLILTNPLKYPYSYNELKLDNPNTSFPKEITDKVLSDWNVYHVKPINKPEVDYTKNVTEGTPIEIDGEWVQTWEITQASETEIAEREQQNIENLKQLRQDAYREESDPLFFKWQRGEATEQEWLNKVQEIKEKYNY
jgi:hypothetical protein